MNISRTIKRTSFLAILLVTVISIGRSDLTGTYHQIGEWFGLRKIFGRHQSYKTLGEWVTRSSLKCLTVSNQHDRYRVIKYFKSGTVTSNISGLSMVR